MDGTIYLAEPRLTPRVQGDEPDPRVKELWNETVPRSRGDKPQVRGREPSLGQLAPHGRGWTVIGGRTSAVRHTHPPARGDGPLTGNSAASLSMASPHTRGWTRQAHRIG